MFKQKNASFRFLLLCLGLTFLYWNTISLPYMSFSIAKYIGIDPLSLIGSGGVLGPKKIHALKYIEQFVIFLICISFIISLRHSGRLIRMGILCLVLPLILISHTWIGMSPLGDITMRIHQARLPSVDYDAIFSKSNLHPESLSSFNDFYEAVEKNYALYSSVLSERWQIKDDAHLRSLFYLNTVSHLFAYGNHDLPNKSGCTASNEDTNFINRKGEDLGIKLYLDSIIGCCSDYTFTLKYLLDRAHIENRMISLPIHGHWFNEVKLSNQWYALDGNIGAFYPKGWDEIVEGDEPFQVLLFPTLSDDMTKKTFRPIFGTFKQKQLLVAASGAEKATYVNELPAWIH